MTHLSQLDLSKTYTYADYLTWRFGEAVELLKGKILAMSPAPSRKHQAVSRQLSILIFNYFTAKKCEAYAAPFDVRFPTNPNAKRDKDIYTVVQPDFCVICDREKLDDRGCIGAPDLIAEIVSIGTEKRDRKDKRDLYEEFGVREYWIADPYERLVEVYVLDEKGCYGKSAIYGEGDSFHSFLFPDLAIQVDEVFVGD